MRLLNEMDVDVLVQSGAQPRMSKSPAPPTVTSPATTKPKSPPTAPAAPPLPPSPTSNNPPAHTLASLLSNALIQIDSLKEKLKIETSRADHFEVLAKDYRDLLGKGATPESERGQPEITKGEDKNDASMDDVRSKDQANQLAAATEKIRQLRESVTAAEEVRDEEIARRIAISDLWTQLNQYLERLDSAGKDVRMGFDRIVKSGNGGVRDYSHMFKDFPQMADGELMKYDRSYNSNGVLTLPSRRHEYSREERHGARRPRSGSMDAYAYTIGPNSKRVRYQDDHPHHASGSGVSPTYYQPAPHLQQPPPPGGSNHPLSPSHMQPHQHTMIQNIPYPQSQVPPPPLAASSSSSSRHRDRRHPDSASMHAPDHPGNLYPVSNQPSYEHPHRSQDHPREYHDDRRRRRRDRSRSYSPGRSHSRGSEGSMDLDEMLLATTSDEQHMQLNGNGLPGASQVLVSGRAKARPMGSHASGIVYDSRDAPQYAPQPSQHSLSPHDQHLSAHHSSQHLGGPPPPPHVVQYNNPQSGPPSGPHSPPYTSSSRPGSSRRVLRSEPTLREEIDRRQGSLSQSTGPGQVQYQTHVFAPVQTGAPVKKSKFSNTSANASSANVVEETKSPAVNPNPVAPNNSTSSLPLTSVNLAPTTSPFPPTNEQGQRICRQCGMPGRYKEGKCVEKCRKKMKRVERRGTIEQAQLLAAQQAHNRSQTTIGNSSSSYGSFPTPQRENTSAKIGRTDTVIVDNGRHTFEEPTVSSIRSTSNARVVTSTPFNKSTKSGSRPTSKAASRAGSIVDGSRGSRRSSPAPSTRSNLATSMTISNSRNHTSNASVHSNGSGSGMDIDADADGDAEADLDDPEAEVEGDIAALVDQAASPRPHAKSRNEEDVDIAALAGVDDDPDDYDTPATTKALRRQQAARAAAGGGSAYGGSMSGKEVSSGPSADAELDILEAVDAAEANSATGTSSKTEES